MAGSRRQRKLPLNNCAEAESAGSNPLSGVQLIITTVCLSAEPDDDATAHVCVFQRDWHESDRSPVLVGQTGHIARDIWTALTEISERMRPDECRGCSGDQEASDGL